MPSFSYYTVLLFNHTGSVEFPVGLFLSHFRQSGAGYDSFPKTSWHSYEFQSMTLIVEIGNGPKVYFLYSSGLK